MLDRAPTSAAMLEPLLNCGVAWSGTMWSSACYSFIDHHPIDLFSNHYVVHSLPVVITDTS